MLYFIGFLAACATWVAIVYLYPILIEDIKKEFADRAKMLERVQNPPPCRDCAWYTSFDNTYNNEDLGRCNNPLNPWKYAETFRKSECGKHAKYFEEVK